MSFILDALKRADQERRQEPLSVTFDSSSELLEEAPAQRNLGLIIGVVILLLVVLALAGYFAIQARQTPQSPTNDAAVAMAQPPSEPSAQELETSTDAGRPVAQDPSKKPDVTASEMPSPQANASPAQLTQPQVQQSAEDIDSLYGAELTAEAPEQAVEQLYLEPEPQQVANRTQAETDTPPPANASNRQNQIPDATPEPEPATPAMPQIRDLPWSLQQKIPSISYSSHNYSETGLSYVVINGEQRRAGQQLENGLRLEEIVADGAVLSFEGRRFKLPALSSWVNM